MKTTVIDFETSGLPDEVLDTVKPEFTAPSNYKDAVKIAESIKAQELEWRSRAALDATTGKLLAMGLLEGDSFSVIEGNEPDMLKQFWTWLEQELAASNIVAGFCIFRFDLVFAIRRSYVHGVKVPSAIRRGRYWADGLIDVAELWQCGNRDQTISLDRLAKVLGVGSKSGSGADFAGLWETDRAAALEYLKNDLMLTKACYERMC